MRQRGRLSAVLAWLIIFFLLGPIVLIALMSFESDGFIAFPPSGFSFRWFESVFSDSQWLASLRWSLAVAAVAAAIAATIGTVAILASLRTPHWVGVSLLVLTVAPAIVPPMIIAVALYFLFTDLNLVGSLLALSAGQSLLGIPVVAIVVRSTLGSFDRRLELAARGLGASDSQAVRLVVLPHLYPAVASGSVFAFLLAFDDVIIALFLSSAGVNQTVQLKIWNTLQNFVSPEIMAVSVVLICISVVALAVAGLAPRIVGAGSRLAGTRRT